MRGPGRVADPRDYELGARRRAVPAWGKVPHKAVDTSVVYLTTKGVSRASGETQAVVRWAVRTGELKPVDTGKVRHIFHPEEVKRWILSRE